VPNFLYNSELKSNSDISKTLYTVGYIFRLMIMSHPKIILFLNSNIYLIKNDHYLAM